MTYNLLTKQSMPNHPKNKEGVCLVIGTHPCWEADFENACEAVYRSGLELKSICAVNDAYQMVGADYLATCHPEKLDQFVEGQDDVEIHTHTKMSRPKPRKNEYVWSMKIGGGSALFACAVMISIGYDLVVMCGCPVNGGGGYAAKTHQGSDKDPRLGYMRPSNDVVLSYHRHMRRFKQDSPYSDRVRSMSGATKHIFGDLKS